MRLFPCRISSVVRLISPLCWCFCLQIDLSSHIVKAFLTLKVSLFKAYSFLDNNTLKAWNFSSGNCNPFLENPFVDLFVSLGGKYWERSCGRYASCFPTYPDQAFVYGPSHGNYRQEEEENLLASRCQTNRTT